MGELSNQVMNGLPLLPINLDPNWEEVREMVEAAPYIFVCLSDLAEGHGALSVGGVEGHPLLTDALRDDHKVTRKTNQIALRDWWKICDFAASRQKLPEKEWRSVLSWATGEWPDFEFSQVFRERLEEFVKNYKGCHKNLAPGWHEPYLKAAEGLLSLKK